MVASAASKANPETQRRIDNICRSNEDYGFCNKVFQRDIPQPDVDNFVLTNITIVEALMNASNSLEFIRAQIAAVENDPVRLIYYKVCEDAYSILKQSFELAFQAFKKGDYKEVQSNERESPRVQARCVTIFTLTQHNTMNERNREMRILITMALVSVTNIL
ncbi:uncharacterized protein LOC130797104 [Amaranthus tricolor]|uniref:uncharacterized protein LOC130797104 n=1 Tax=Amaranthus tricolor TaxID=29722 RepID=UPI00258B3AD7|nr:uncharacterized protein LOC130797104 [Amaranthus tricolor]